jgi:hypothetical protein
MLSFINRIKQVITKELPKPLGRWNIDYCNKKIDQKIDLSNEDHCGPCGQYIISKSTKTLNDKITENVKN